MKIIDLEGSKNIRDLGGTKVKNGIIKNNKLLRGTVLDKLTKNDIKILVNDYELKTVVDLRTDREIREKKNLLIEGIKYIHLPLFNDNILGISHEQDNSKSISEMDIDMCQLYKKMLSERYLNNISQIISYIINLNNNQYSVLYHCTEGKDRTGIISAILLMILEADNDTIIEDYLYTNIANKEIKKVKKREHIFDAKKECIECVLDIIKNEWNGINNFVEKALKIKNEEIMEFRNKVINENKKI